MTSGLLVMKISMNKRQYIEKKIQEKKTYQQNIDRTLRLVRRNEMKRIYYQNMDRELRLVRRNRMRMKQNSFSLPDKLNLKNVFQENPTQKTDRELRLVRRNGIMYQHKTERMTHFIHKNDVKNEVSLEISNIITPKNRILSTKNTTQNYLY
jgi:hypothetical protein